MVWIQCTCHLLTCCLRKYSVWLFSIQVNVYCSVWDPKFPIVIIIHWCCCYICSISMLVCLLICIFLRPNKKYFGSRPKVPEKLVLWRYCFWFFCGVVPHARGSNIYWHEVNKITYNHLKVLILDCCLRITIAIGFNLTCTERDFFLA